MEGQGLQLPVLPSHQLGIWIDPVVTVTQAGGRLGQESGKGRQEEGPEVRGWGPQEQ